MRTVGTSLPGTSAHTDAVVSSPLKLAAPDLRAFTLAHGHRGERRRMPELTFPPRVACAPSGFPCLRELTVAGHVVASEPGELRNWGRWGDGGGGS